MGGRKKGTRGWGDRREGEGRGEMERRGEEVEGRGGGFDLVVVHPEGGEERRDGGWKRGGGRKGGDRWEGGNGRGNGWEGGEERKKIRRG